MTTAGAARAADVIVTWRFAPRFLNWAVRLWVAGACQKQPVHEIIDEAFGRLGRPEGLLRLDAFLTLVACDSAKVIEVRCRGCPQASADELRLAAILADGQRDDRAGAAARLAELLGTPASPATLAAALGLADDLSAARLFLDPLPVVLPRPRPVAEARPQATILPLRPRALRPDHC